MINNIAERITRHDDHDETLKCIKKIILTRSSIPSLESWQNGRIISTNDRPFFWQILSASSLAKTATAGENISFKKSYELWVHFVMLTYKRTSTSCNTFLTKSSSATQRISSNTRGYSAYTASVDDLQSIIAQSEFTIAY